MTAYLSKAVYCLYCVWPALVGGIGWFLSRMVEGKTYYGALTPGVDPASPQGQQEFETRRQRNAEKRRIIYWTAGIIVFGYAAVLLWNTFSITTKTAAAPAETPTLTAEISATPETGTPEPFTPTPSPVPSGTPLPSPTSTATYAPTATNRVVYVAGPEVTVVVTVVVERVITATPTFTPTPTGAGG